MIRNFAKRILDGGGQITPILISPRDSNGLGLLNPSIFIDNEEPWCILRNVNYTEYHTENHQIYNNRWGPLSYLNPENDPHLRTWNFLCKLNKDTLAVEKYWKIDTSTLDKEPLWEFVGLEDARLVRWDGALYGIGVRRDTTTNGQGRMEFSELKCDERFNRVKEVARFRVEHPVNPEWYCEKNWMPIIDMPFHFVKYTNPAEVVTCDLSAPPLPNGMVKSWRPFEPDESQSVPGIPFLRGGSQVIPWRDFRVAVVHEVDLRKNYLDQKDATYRHRFVTWDRDWNLINITDTVSFMGGELEFVCGAAIYRDDLIVGFSVQDNCAYHLRIPGAMISWALGIDQIDWGHFSKSTMTRDYIRNEVIDTATYEREYKVKEGDTVLDIGASVGPFIWSIAGRKPARVIAVEPDARCLRPLRRNCAAAGIAPEIIEKGIAPANGKFITRGLFSNRFSNDTWEGEPAEIDGITFKSLVGDLGLERIDFLKTDCEGSEYDIFNDENLEWIKHNVRRAAGEFHLHNKAFNAKWIHFRDTYLKTAGKFSIYSVDGACITDSVWSDGFADYYKAVLVYLNNCPRTKWQLAHCPSIEITTTIPAHGCPMRCTVCPQDALTVAYDGVQTLSVENFKKLIDKVPTEILVSFTGLVEPFLNPGCSAMIRHAHDTGHAVAVFTTAVGMKPSDLEAIKHIPFTGIQGGFVLHLPDEEGYLPEERWHVHEELLEAVKLLSNFEALTMGTLPDRLREIFPNVIRRPLYSRAGNIDRPDVIQIDTKPASTCGCRERLYHNILLPNGDVTLCCMDYGLKHILGNLHESSYEDVVPVDNTPFELCRHCENGRPV